jgi:hypothetical protein
LVWEDLCNQCVLTKFKKCFRKKAKNVLRIEAPWTIFCSHKIIVHSCWFDSREFQRPSHLGQKENAKNVTYIRNPSSHKLPSLNHYIKLHKRSSSHFFCKIRAALPARRVIKLFASAFVFFSQYSQRKNGKSCARPSCRLSFTLGCPDCMRCRRIYLCASGGQCAKCEKI